MPEIEITKKEEKELLAKGLFTSPFFTIVASVIATFIIAFFFSKIGGEVPISITSTTVEKQHTLDVSGEGRAEVVPDIARASLGITVSRNTVSAAQREANSVLNSIKQSLQGLGIEERDFRTISYNINPDYSFEEGRSRIVGYNVNSQFEVAFRDFEILNQAIDTATQAGANLVGQLRFELSREARQEAEDEARAEAVAEAKRKAEKIAKTAGVDLGKVINVKESPVAEPPIFRSLALEETEEAQTQISPGTSEIKVRVTLSFETK